MRILTYFIIGINERNNCGLYQLRCNTSKKQDHQWTEIVLTNCITEH